MPSTCVDHRDDIQVGSPLPRATVRDTDTGYLASCRDCQWMGLFPDGVFADDAVQTHYNRSHYGPSSYVVVFLVGGTRAQCLESNRGRLTPIQADRPTFPRTTGDVSDLVGRGDRIRLPGDREQMVRGVTETRTFGLPTWTVSFCDPDVDLVDDDPDWRGMNELIARDGDVYCRFGETYLGAPAFEIDGQADHQADLSSFDHDRAVTDGGSSSSDTYRCIHEDCGETFSHKVRARDHARKHMPSVGNYGMYDFIEIIPERERPLSTGTEESQ